MVQSILKQRLFLIVLIIFWSACNNAVEPVITDPEEILPPVSFSLLLPQFDADSVSLFPVFQWENSDGASTYSLWLSENSNLDNEQPLIENAPWDTMYQIDEELSRITTYYWKVIAYNDSGMTQCTETFRFITTELTHDLIVESITLIDSSTYPIIEVVFSESMMEYIGEERWNYSLKPWFKLNGDTVERFCIDVNSNKVTIFTVNHDYGENLLLRDGGHTLEITTNVKSTAGSTLPENHTWTFTTHTPGLRNSFYAPDIWMQFNLMTMDDDGYIYVGTKYMKPDQVEDQNWFYKLDSELNTIWEYYIGKGDVWGEPALDNQGDIYFVVYKNWPEGSTFNQVGHLTKLSSSGAFQWEREVPTFRIQQGGELTPTVSIDNTIYIGGDGLKAYNTDGSLLWTYNSNLNIRSKPGIDALGNICFLAAGSDPIEEDPVGSGMYKGKIEMHCINSEGNVIWLSETREPDNMPNINTYYASPLFTSDGSVVAAIASTVYLLDGNSGTIIWQSTPVIGAIPITPAIDVQNNVYIGTKGDENSGLYKFSGSDGSLLWSLPHTADNYSTPHIADDGLLYHGVEYGLNLFNIFIINKETGEVLKSTIGPHGHTVRDIVSHQGKIYINDASRFGEKGAIYAFDIVQMGH